MNHRTASILIIAAFALVTAMMIFTPASGDQSTNTISTSAASEQTFEGILVVKEADGVFIVRSEDGKQKRFTLNKDTLVTRNGETASYRDLRSRDRLRVTYSPDFVVIEIQATGDQV